MCLYLKIEYLRKKITLFENNKIIIKFLKLISININIFNINILILYIYYIIKYILYYIIFIKYIINSSKLNPINSISLLLISPPLISVF